MKPELKPLAEKLINHIKENTQTGAIYISSIQNIIEDVNERIDILMSLTDDYRFIRRPTHDTGEYHLTELGWKFESFEKLEKEKKERADKVRRKLNAEVVLTENMVKDFPKTKKGRVGDFG